MNRTANFREQLINGSVTFTKRNGHIAAATTALILLIKIIKFAPFAFTAIWFTAFGAKRMIY